MSSIIHCQEKLINSTLMKTWAIFYFAAEKSRISICCLVMCWFSPLGCSTDVHHICRYLKYLLSSTTFALSKHHRVRGKSLMTAKKIQKKKSNPEHIFTSDFFFNPIFYLRCLNREDTQQNEHKVWRTQVLSTGVTIILYLGLHW